MSSFGTKSPDTHTAPGAVVGLTAAYRRYDYFFQREQSSSLRDAVWEGRARPFTPWNEIVAIGLIGAAGVAAAALAVL
jgi:hypothetical protein